MIIKSLTIENFKAIREAVKIDFKPITLLFGPNSSGKSTIIHALHYAWEVIGRHNLDPNYTAYGGDSVDLGGFENLVHGHDKKRSIYMRFDLDLTKRIWPIYATPEAIALTETYQVKDHLSVLHWNSKLNDSISAWVEFKVSWSEHNQAPFVSSYSIGIDNERIASIKSADSGSKVEIVYINFFHPLFFIKDEDNYFNEAVVSGYLQEPTYPFSETVNLLSDSIFYAANSHQDWLDASTMPKQWYNRLKLASQIISKENLALDTQNNGSIFDKIPIEEAIVAFIPLKYWLLCRHFFDIKTIDGKIQIQCGDLTDAMPKWGEKLNVGQRSREDFDFETTVATMSQIVVGPGELLRDTLNELRYIGPIRSSVHRNYLPNRYIEKYRWANGLAAWDALHEGNDDFITLVNEWISERFKCGYRIKRKVYKELPTDKHLENMLDSNDIGAYKAKVKKLNLHRKIVLIDEKYDVEVAPPDIGTGIIQALPIIIAALYDNRGLIVLEQPELHIHPAFQVSLGDLFISQILDNKDVIYLIETHSEHLMLRLLRRIRETSEDSVPSGKDPLQPDQIAVYYVEQSEKGARLTKIQIDKDGEFIDQWPEGFFEEREDELLY